MSEVFMLLVLLCVFMGFESRSVSIVFSHREKYEVKDEQERSFIDLPDEIIKRLGLDEASKEDLLESQLKQLPNAEHATVSKTKHVNTAKFQDKVPDVTVTSKVPDVTVTSDDGFFSQSGKEDSNQLDTDEDEGEVLHDNGSDDLNSETEEENEERNPSEVQKDDEMIDNDSAIEHHHLFKRAAEVNEQWRHSLPGHKKRLQRTEDDIKWEEVTDEDLERAAYGEYTRTAKFVGLTLLSVMCFVFLGYCFIRDPVAFVFALGTGCPCCLICCPCIRKFTDKYLNVKNIIRDSMNRYMPGVIIKDDGTFDTYEPTSEELAIMEEIMEEMLDE